MRPEKDLPGLQIRLRAGGWRLSTNARLVTQEPVGDEALDCRCEPHR